MKKLVICMSVLAFSAVLFAQTDTRQAAENRKQEVTPSKDKQAFSVDTARLSSSPAKGTTGPAKEKPETAPSTYVNGKAKLEESGFRFGYTPMNCTIFHSFYIKNVGTDTLDIVKVVPG